jgi:large subunit ribosomal protein L4
METKVFNQSGKEIGKIPLPENIFDVPWNSDLVHQVVVSMTSSSRRGTAHTKDRGEVRGGGKKPWKQKGTGQARHGSTRSPIWVGGGVTHGPRSEKNYDRKVNRKMKTKALFTILSRKMRDGEVFFVDEFKLSEPKTKHAAALLMDLRKDGNFEKALTKKTNVALIVLGERDDSLLKSFRNIGNVAMDETRNINPVTLLQYKNLIVVNPEASLRSLSSRLENAAPEGTTPMPKVKKTKAIKKTTPRAARANKKTAVKKTTSKK